VPYRLVDHTADLAIEATGPTQEAVLADAALALTEVVTGKPAPQERAGQEMRFQIEAPDQAALAVAFLSELLWLLESRDMLWLGGAVTLSAGLDGTVRLEGRGQGVRYDPHRHGRGVEVKAVTYHDLVFGREGKEWRLWVLLDI
jgi:SHS2 domain-containing protein